MTKGKPKLVGSIFQESIQEVAKLLDENPRFLERIVKTHLQVMGGFLQELISKSLGEG